MDAPHPWTLHDPGDTDAPARITDDDGAKVTPQRAWREIQVLRAERNLYKFALKFYAKANNEHWQMDNGTIARAALDREDT